MRLEIRLATARDLGAIQNLNRELCKTEHKKFDSSIDPDWSLTREGKEHFRKRIAQKDGCVLVAVAENKIVGYLAGCRTEAERYRDIKKITELENMFVAERYRSHGIGTKLYRAFLGWCKRKGIKRIRAVVSAKNIKAINFYKRNKFVSYTVTLEKEV